MAGKPDAHEQLEIQERRRKVADLYIKGWRQSAIAEVVGVHVSNVCRDLAAIREEWREARLDSTEAWIDAQLAKIDKMELEAWEQWEKSKGDRKKTTKKESEGADGSGPRLEKTLSIEDGLGDPRYLAMVDKAIERRSKLLGLEKAPQDNKGSELPADIAAAVRQLRQGLLKDDGFQCSGNLEADTEPDGLGTDG